MRIAVSIVSAAVLASAASARASSIIPSNYVDDFGSLAVSTPTDSQEPHPTAHASPIPSNFVDDFGSLTPREQTAAPGGTAVTHASPIPNYLDDFTLPPENPAPGYADAGPERIQTAMTAQP